MHTRSDYGQQRASGRMGESLDEASRLLEYLGNLENALDEAVLGQAHPEIERLSARILGAREALNRFSCKSNPQKKSRRPVRRDYASGVKQDVLAGRLSEHDVYRRIGYYRKVLAETIAHDPEARERIVALVEHIKDLEGMIRSLGRAR